MPLSPAYPASLVVTAPDHQVTPRSLEDDLTVSRRLSWLLASLYSCDLEVVVPLAQVSHGRSVVQYGVPGQGPSAILQSLLSEYGEAKWRLVDSVLVTSSSMRLSPILWWLATQAPQVHLVHMVRNPRGVLAEMMATARLRGTPLAEEEVRSQLADLCQDLRDDLAAAGNLHHSRYTRIK